MIDFEAKSGPEMVGVIERNNNKISNVAIYNKAMQKCSKWRDSGSVQRIMDSLLSSKVSPDIISFGTFIDCMANSDAPVLCIEYFGRMVNEHGIRPNVIVFGSLMKCFKKQSKVVEAEKCFGLMATKYGINPK